MRPKLPALKSKFFYLLAALILYCISASFAGTNVKHDFYLSIFFSLIVVACLLSLAQQRVAVGAIIFLGISSLILHWIISTIQPSPKFHVSFYLANIIFLFFVTYFVLYSITKHHQVTADTLLGAVCGYFLVAFIWSDIYLLINILNPSAFSKLLTNPSLHKSAEQAMYYSFTTMTTLGYGDILPLSPVARTFSWLEAVAGQIYLAVWISQLVGLQIAQKR